MILVCYDGSADAQAAIDRAAQLMPDAETTVLTIWEPFSDAIAHSDSMGMGMGFAGTNVDDQKVDQASEEAALKTATEGSQRATAAGLVAQPRIASRHGDIAYAILTVAADADVDAVVLGTGGLGSVKSFLLGSVSHGVVQHADRAVLVVPSCDIAEQRHGQTRDRA